MSKLTLFIYRYSGWMILLFCSFARVNFFLFLLKLAQMQLGAWVAFISKLSFKIFQAIRARRRCFVAADYRPLLYTPFSFLVALLLCHFLLKSPGHQTHIYLYVCAGSKNKRLWTKLNLNFWVTINNFSRSKGIFNFSFINFLLKNIDYFFQGN